MRKVNMLPLNCLHSIKIPVLFVRVLLAGLGVWLRVEHLPTRSEAPRSVSSTAGEGGVCKGIYWNEYYK